MKDIISKRKSWLFIKPECLPRGIEDRNNFFLAPIFRNSGHQKWLENVQAKKLKLGNRARPTLGIALTENAIPIFFAR